jgi:hypothetical protein
MNMDLDWRDPERPWWVKLRRAGCHLDELRRAVASFNGTKPWRLEAESGRQPGEVAYRFRIMRSIPTDLAVIAGEVIYHLRSALDTVVYELALQRGGSLTQRQERLPAFKSSIDEDAFRKSTEQRLRDLCGSRGLAALRSVQPFAFAAEAAAVGVSVEREAEIALAMDIPYRLNVLWNLDKHRRLLTLEWHVDVYWSQGGTSARWEPTLDRTGPLTDGTLLGHFNAGQDHEEGSVEPRFELLLRLTDDSCPYTNDLCKLLTSWHDSLGGWVVPRMFITVDADGSPPILIPGGWPYR